MCKKRNSYKESHKCQNETEEDCKKKKKTREFSDSDWRPATASRALVHV